MGSYRNDKSDRISWPGHRTATTNMFKDFKKHMSIRRECVKDFILKMETIKK